MTNRSLSPCPFCGGKVIKLTSTDGRYMIRCGTCFCGTGIYADIDRAIETWQRRTKEENKGD